ncbi:hypothetical protein GYMLUDRAFT_249403, partial [Collybiopsis luxurians FD-317 M1]
MPSDKPSELNEAFTPMQPLRPRKKNHLHLSLLIKLVYAVVTRILFFIGLVVVVRGLVSPLAQLKQEAKLLVSSRYRAIYQNQTLDMVTNRTTVVQPLIGEDQLFDIGVTIWARATREEEKEWYRSKGKNRTVGGFPAIIDGPVLLDEGLSWGLRFQNSSQLS